MNTPTISHAPLIDAQDAAGFLGIGRRKVYELARNRQIPAYRVGGLWKFRTEELDRWLETRRTG